MTERNSNIVTLLPRPAFLLELHSERMVDALHALHDAGFTVTRVKGTNPRFPDRYRIDDAKEQERCQQ